MPDYAPILDMMQTSEDNFGGFHEIKIIPRHWVSDINWVDPDVRSGVLSFDIETYGNPWFTIKCLNDTHGYTEKQKESKAGTYYECKLVGVINTVDANQIMNTNNFRHIEFIADCTTRNGLRRLIGHPKKAMRFSADYESGFTPLDNERYLISLDINLVNRAPKWVPA